MKYLNYLALVCILATLASCTLCKVATSPEGFRSIKSDGYTISYPPAEYGHLSKKELKTVDKYNRAGIDIVSLIYLMEEDPNIDNYDTQVLWHEYFHIVLDQNDDGYVDDNQRPELYPKGYGSYVIPCLDHLTSIE